MLKNDIIETNVIEVKTEQDYCAGLSYLMKKRPQNYHMISCYEGIATCNLARMINFDKCNKIIEAKEYKKKHRIYLIKENEIKGVMVVISLPEFGAELDYETYVLIETEEERYYNNFIKLVSNNERLEIIAFRDEQCKWADKLVSPYEIHYWQTFGFYHCSVINELIDIGQVRNAIRDDISLSEILSKNMAIEKSPFRFINFELAGLPYKNFVYPANGEPRVLLGIKPYCFDAVEISYITKVSDDESISNNYIISLIEYIKCFAKRNQLNIIWRMRQSEYDAYTEIIKTTGFELLTTEQHFHIDMEGTKKR